MRRHLSFEPAPVTDTLDDPRDESGAVQHAHLTRHTNVGVNKRVVVGDHVLVGCFGRNRVFEGISRTVEEEAP